MPSPATSSSHPSHGQPNWRAIQLPIAGVERYQSEQTCRINDASIQDGLEVKVASGRVAGGADVADELSLRDMLSGSHHVTAQVVVARHEGVAVDDPMADLDLVARGRRHGGIPDFASRCCVDWRAALATEPPVQAGVDVATHSAVVNGPGGCRPPSEGGRDVSTTHWNREPPAAGG